MALLLDPPIARKVRQMRSRVRWQAPPIQAQGIDQTRLSIADGLATTPAFSFLVIGDSGFGSQPQQQVAHWLRQHQEDCQFLLHTGDVVYAMGAPQQYRANFIQPYRDWLANAEASLPSYRNLVFRKPFLAVPGNHDYYNVPLPYGLAATAVQPFRRLLTMPPANVSLRGSSTGDTYARVFLDYLRGMSDAALATHLATHYTTETDTGRSLTYRPAAFTRLPNRYYHFRYGGIDFLALDSSTFNRPVAVDGAAALRSPQRPNDLPADLDWDQLYWLRNRLVQSWQTPQVRGRILYLHHPPYVTEASKLTERACLTVRHHLRWALDAAAIALDRPNGGLVNLVLSGHAHCFEYLRSLNTGHADAHTDWLICGGSGARLRRQATERTLTAATTDKTGSSAPLLAKSQLFVGRHDTDTAPQKRYSCLRVDVQAGDRPRFVARPLIAEKHREEWHHYELSSLMLSAL